MFDENTIKMSVSYWIHTLSVYGDSNHNLRYYLEMGLLTLARMLLYLEPFFLFFILSAWPLFIYFGSIVLLETVALKFLRKVENTYIGQIFNSHRNRIYYVLI